jgi:hypothetical protein
MSNKDNYIIINDYFDYKENILSLERKNKELDTKIQELEKIIYQHLPVNKKGAIIKMVDTYNSMWTFYERTKIISLVILFLFGNKLLTEPYIFHYIYNILKYIVS